ncbi:MAG: M1 family metallopeptidase [Clostridia bacterium]|nr:M1 family metallopeptidase [Clostridia bacterium]
MKKFTAFALSCLCFAGTLPALSACKTETEVHSRYEITAEYVPENGTLTGAVKVTFENNTSEELSVLKFQLYPNAYRKDALYKPVSKACENAAYYNGDSYGEIVVSSVNGAKNWEVMGEDENILYVYLERSLFPDEKVVLDIGFMLKLAEVDHRTGITENTVNFGNAFPILCAFKDGGFCETVYYSDGDPFLSDCADYKLTLKTPKDYVLASTGETTSERTLESKKEYVVEADNVRDFAFVLSDKFRTVQTLVNGTPIVYYYYADEKARDTLTVAAESFAYYEETFGEYPYGRYALVQTGFCHGGMEYPMLSMISDDLTETENARVVAHETAHQWWYAVVGSDQTENAWQDEGLAEYSAIAFFENHDKYGVRREAAVADALKEYRSYYDVYGSVLGRTDTKMTRNLKEYLSDYEYKCLSYDKAVVMFDTLRKSVGDKKFFAGLKKYYAENKFAVATPENMVGAFERVGLDVSGFFDSFLSGKAIL